jgi:regulator of replication initiation timing
MMNLINISNELRKSKRKIYDLERSRKKLKEENDILRRNLDSNNIGKHESLKIKDICDISDESYQNLKIILQDRLHFPSLSSIKRLRLNYCKEIDPIEHSLGFYLDIEKRIKYVLNLLNINDEIINICFSIDGVQLSKKQSLINLANYFLIS